MLSLLIDRVDCLRSRYILTVAVAIGRCCLICLACAFSFSCRRDAELVELPPVYCMANPGDIPVVLEAAVLENGEPVGSVHPSRFDGCPHQLWRVNVHVENILVGTVPSNNVNIFYSLNLGSLGTSGKMLKLSAGDRAVFFLMRDSGRLRLVCDGWENSIARCFSGRHPRFVTENQPTHEVIMKLLLSRGEGITDQQMISEIARMAGSRRFGEAALIKQLQRLVTTETRPVAEFACKILRDDLKQACPE